MEKQTVKGFKITNPDSKCRGFLFEIGKTYSHDGKIELCVEGFHFCQKANHCFSYYSFDSTNLVYEVEAIGEVLHGEDKSVTNHIKIIRLLTWDEVLNVANSGNNNTGHSNTGNRNTGDNTVKLFDKDSKMTYPEFENSRVYRLLCDVDTKFWVPSEAMTDKEKVKYPSHSTCGGYLKDIPYKEAFQNKWGNWSKENRQHFIDLPNFDKNIFFQITGVNIEE